MGEMLFGFGGRLARLRYFLLSLVAGIVLTGAAGVLAVGIYATGARISQLALIACAVLFVAALVVLISLTIRRLHDLNRTGWWTVAVLGGPCVVWLAATWLADDPKLDNALAFLTLIAIELWLWLAPGTRGPNRFGADPRGTT